MAGGKSLMCRATQGARHIGPGYIEGPQKPAISRVDLPISHPPTSAMPRSDFDNTYSQDSSSLNRTANTRPAQRIDNNIPPPRLDQIPVVEIPPFFRSVDAAVNAATNVDSSEEQRPAPADDMAYKPLDRDLKFQRIISAIVTAGTVAKLQCAPHNLTSDMINALIGLAADTLITTDGIPLSSRTRKSKPEAIEALKEWHSELTERLEIARAHLEEPVSDEEGEEGRPKGNKKGKGKGKGAEEDTAAAEASTSEDSESTSD
jgi:hypothetical protein